jgi:hypothetical protein
MRKRKLTLAISASITALCMLNTVQAQTNPQEDFMLLEQEKAANQVYKAFFPNEDIARKAAISFHGQLLESHYEQGYLIMELTEKEQEKLAAFGFTFEPANEFIAKRNEVLTLIQNRLQQRSLKSATAMSDASLASIPGYACYETLESTYSVASGMASQFRRFAR